MQARKALLIPLSAVLVAIAGCGGSEVAYEEVDVPPPTLTIPKDTGSSAGPSASATPTTTPTATPTASSGTSGTTGGATSGGTTSGGTTSGGATGGTTPSQTQTTPQDTGGASPDQGLDQFCADNPGACDGGANP
jgi:hypothetical protein